MERPSASSEQSELLSNVIVFDTNTFTFKGGADKYTNSSIKQSLSRVTKPAAAKLQGNYKWALGANEENGVLNFRHQKAGETVCYERMK